MITVPNQKVITVLKEKCDKHNRYALYNIDALHYAMQDLKGETFKLWCYLGKNQDEYEFALSKVDAINFGVGSKSSYDRAVKELIEKKYLVETSPNHYDFYERPQDDEVIFITKKAANDTNNWYTQNEATLASK